MINVDNIIAFCLHLVSKIQWILINFHLSEVTGQALPVVMKISLLIKTFQPNQSNAK